MNQQQRHRYAKAGAKRAITHLAHQSMPRGTTEEQIAEEPNLNEIRLPTKEGHCKHPAEIVCRARQDSTTMAWFTSLLHWMEEATAMQEYNLREQQRKIMRSIREPRTRIEAQNRHMQMLQISLERMRDLQTYSAKSPEPVPPSAAPP